MGMPLVRSRPNGVEQVLRLSRLNYTRQRTHSVVGSELLCVQPAEPLQLPADMIKASFARHDANTKVNNFLK